MHTKVRRCNITEDPIRNYSNATGELDKAIANINKLRDIAADVGHELSRKPYEFVVSNVDVGLPMEVTFNKNAFTLNANEWPTAKTIAETIANLHAKKAVVERAWHSLNEADRKLVKKPDFLSK